MRYSQQSHELGNMTFPILFYGFFFFCQTERQAYGSLVPGPGIEPAPPAVQAWYLNHFPDGSVVKIPCLHCRWCKHGILTTEPSGKFLPILKMWKLRFRKPGHLIRVLRLAGNSEVWVFFAFSWCLSVMGVKGFYALDGTRLHRHL